VATTGNIMHKRNPHQQSAAKTVFWLLLEIIIYTAFVVGYGAYVLPFLRGWLKDMFDTHKAIYAIIALPLIITQAVLLHFVTMALRKLGPGKPK
jgi:Kef-type K+ transport system membrane component KefB